MSELRPAGEQGFTLIELLMAMTVFSFMLVIIVVGFTNIVRIHNAAIASNITQDSASAGMNAVVNAVRDSAGLVSITPSTTVSGSTDLCLDTKGGAQQLFYLTAIVAGQYQLNRADGCTVKANPVALTSATVTVPYFNVVQKTMAPSIANFKPELQITIKVASQAATSVLAGSGSTVKCNTNTYDREFCSVVTLTSGAVPR